MTSYPQNSQAFRACVCALAAGMIVIGCTAPSETAKPIPAPPFVPTASTIVGRWDLQTIDHKNLPNGMEGHLILASDGTYRRWTVTQEGGRRDSVIFGSSYLFQAAPTPTVTFRLDALNQGTGVFGGGVLSITYVDFLDWPDETWIRSQ